MVFSVNPVSKLKVWMLDGNPALTAPTTFTLSLWILNVEGDDDNDGDDNGDEDMMYDVVCDHILF